jgi:hypothetical protein
VLHRILADLKIATWRVVKIATRRVNQCHALVRRDWRIFFSNVSMDFGIARERVRVATVGEVVDVLRSDDMNLG